MIWLIVVVQSEHVRRMTVQVFPRVRSATQKGTRQTQNTTESTLLVLILIKRPLPSQKKGRQQKKDRTRRNQHSRNNAKAAAPGPREVPGIDLLEGPFLRVWAFF